MPRPARHSPTQKAAILAKARTMLRDGIKRKDVAASLGVNLASLSGWLREQTLDRFYPPLEPSVNPRARK